MKKCNKIIAVILSVVMFIGILPMADIAKLDFSFPFKAYAADVVSSGSCGDNLTWELNDEGVLTISGTGKMKNYSSDSNQPWASYRDQITSVEFPDGLTTIGNYAFRLAENLTEVTLPDSVVSIGDHAFNRCYALETVELNDGLKTLDADAFSLSYALENITLPDSLETLGSYALEQTAITEISVPGSVKIIDTYAFYNCASLAEVTLNNGLTEISDYAFKNTAISSIDLPDTAITIESNAFENCTSLSRVSLSPRTKTIGDCVFKGCTSLRSLFFPKSLHSIRADVFQDSGVTDIYFEGTVDEWIYASQPLVGSFRNPFGDCEIVLHCDYVEGEPSDILAHGSCGTNLTWQLDTDGTFTVSGTGAMKDYSSADKQPWVFHRKLITSLVLPEGMTRVGAYAFRYAENLPEVTLPDSMLSLGSFAFNRCYALETVRLNNGLKTLENDAFSIATGLKHITLPGTLETIGAYAFEQTALTSVSVPAGVETIEKEAFYNCASLTDVTLRNGLVTIGEGAFKNTAITAVALPETVLTVEKDAFSSCSSLTKIVFPLSYIKSNEPGSGISVTSFLDCNALNEIWFGTEKLEFDRETLTAEYNGHTYTLYTGSSGVTWQEAVDACAEKAADAHLATITTCGEELILEFLSVFASGVFDSYFNSGVFLYGTNEGSEGSWYYPNGDDFAYTNWGSDKPENGTGENYLSYGYKLIFGDIVYAWDDVTADRKQKGYLCEWDGDGTHAIDLNVKDAAGQTIRSGYNVKWYRTGNSTPIASGKRLYGASDEETYEYEVILEPALGLSYLQPARGTIPGERTAAECTLSSISTISVSGTIVDAEGNAVSGASVALKQTVNEIYSKTATAVSDGSGRFEAQVSDGAIRATVSSDGYFTQTVDLQSAPSGKQEISVGKVVLTRLPDNKLTLDVLRTTASGEVLSISNIGDIEFSVYNETQERQLTDITVQYPVILFGDGQASPGDTLTVTATAGSGDMRAEPVSVLLDSVCQGTARIDFTENGVIRAIASVPDVMMFVFDGSDSLVGRYTPSGVEIASAPLADGTYTVVFMQANSVLPTVYQLSRLAEFGLAADTDYSVCEAAVSNGEVTDLGVAAPPVFDAGKLSYTDPESTSLTANQSSISVGQYVSLRAEYSVKEKYNTTAQAVEIHLPETASFVVGSLTVDGKPHVYTCENGTVTVNTGKDAAVVRLYVVMTEAGDTAFDASLVCDVDNNAVTQPIGSVSVRAENASISAVSVTPQTSVTVNGKTIANSTVELYDNGVFVGRTTANKVGSWSSELDLVDPVDLSDHIISAKVTTPDGVEFRTAEKTITYDVDAFMVKRVTMINSAQDNVTGQLVEYLTVFDFDKPDHSRHAYNYWPKYPKFTFVVEADGVPENVYSLSVVTYSAAGDRTEVPCYYDDETQTWIGFANYTSGASKPAAVSVSYSAVNAPEGSSVFPNDETLEYQPVAPGFGGVSAYSPISPAVGGAGVVTVCILPSDIAPNASFLLTNDNATIPASRVYRQSSGQVFASFDLSDAPSGQYSLEISGADVRRYDDCFTVDRSLPRGKLKYTMGAGVITATNVGYTDVASPIVAVRGGYYKNAFNNSYNVYKDRLIYLKNGNAEDILNLNVDIVDSGQISVNLQFGGEYLFLQNKEGLAGTIAHGQTAGAEFEYTCIPLPSPKNSNDKKTRAYNQFINQLNNNMSRTPFAYQVLNSHETNLFNALSNASVESYTELELRRSALNLLGMTDKTFSLSAAAMANELTADMETITLENIINAFYLAASGAIGVSATEDTEDLVAGSFSLTRRYSNSLLTETTRLDAGIFGFGWNSNCDARIGPVQTNGNTVLCLALYSDGKTQEFTRGSALTSVFTSTSGNGATAAIKSDGYLVTYASGRSMRFDTDGRLTKMTDENGNDLILTYSDDKVVSVTAEATGESVSYSYSGFYLTSVTTKYGTTNYFYNNDNLLNASQAANFNSLSRIEYPDGSFVEYSYDACGRVSQMKKNEHVQNYAYDLLTVSETDNMGAVNKTSYNSKGRIVRTESASGAVKTYSYDRNGYLASIGNGSGISEIYSYDNDGNLLSYRLSDGSVVSYEYDERGHLTGVTDAAGVETKYERDDAGKPTKIVYADGSSETATYNAKGNLVSSVSRTGVTQSYAYDERGNLVSVQYSTGETILYSYDDAGNRTVIDENGERTLLSYDENNALVSISYPDGNQISYTYDALGRRTCVTDADGYTTGYSYDAYGRLSAVTDGADALISYSYYPDGSVQRMTKANGTYTDYSYDGGILSAIVNRGPSGKTISSVRYTYDENGNISSMTDGNDLWRYGYDAQGQLSYAIEPNGNMTAYQYDAAGNRVSVTTNRSVTEYTSNPLNQYTQIGDVTLEYDAEGNLIRETSAAGEASYEWDYRGRLTKYTAADGDVYEYGYDAFDLRNSVSVNGSVTSYLNDPNGYGLALSSTGDAGTTHYLIADRIVGMEQNGVNYYYNANHLGSVTEITGSDGAVVNRYTYNQEGAVVSAVEGVANLYTYGGVFGLVSDRNGLLYDRARYVSERSDSFISKDLSGQLFDLNYYRYSVNDPLNKIDLTGHCPDAVILLGGLAMFGFLYSALRQMKAYGWSGINWLKAFNAGIGSAFIGVCVLLAWESAMGDIITLCSAGSPLIFRLGAIKELLLSALDGDLNLLYEAFLRGYELYWEDYDLPPIPADGKNDPSGYVYAGVVSNRVAGVTATIYYQGYPLDQFGEPDYDAGLQTIEWTEAEEYDELNPQLTDGAGQYRWDVLDGKWRIKYEKEGYAESWSDWMDVPPEYTDVNINLQTLTAPTVSSVVVYADGARLEFSQYMEISTVNASNAVLTAGGGTVSGIWTPVNAEENFEKTAQYASVFEFVPETQIGGDVTVTVRNVRNYAGIALEAPFTAEASVEIKPESVSAPQELFLSLHGSADVEIRVLPADAGGNKTLSVSCDTPSVLELGASTVQTDADGKAILTVTGSLPGEGIITLTLDGTDLSAQVSINVIGIVCAHETLEDVPGTPADCLSPGCTDGVRCVACGEWITTPEEIPATGHDFGAWTQLDAAYHQRVCANDASHTEKEEHAWDEGKITKAATTTAEGVKTYTCAVCGATRTETTPKALLKHTVTAVNTENGIELTWDKDENADGYIVYRKTTGSYTTLKKITSNETLSFENTTAKPGTKYTYAVRSYRGTENGTLATKAITRLTAITPTLSNVTDGISVKWTKVEGAAGYYIYRKAGTGSYSLVKKITSGDTVSYIDTAVKTKNGTVYTYYVRAYLSTTKGAYTEKKMTRLGAITPTLANASTGITVKWTKVTGASGYYIYRKAGSGSYTLVKKLTSASTVSYSDTAVKTESGTVYTYYVRAYKGTTKGAISAKAITRLGTITPTLANASTGITVKWTKIAGATGYYVYRKAGSGSYSLVKKITSGATVSLTDTDTKNGTSYTYYVRAFKSSTMGAYTVKKIVRLTGVKLTGLSNASSKAMTATWEKNTKATGYQLQYAANSSFTSAKTVTVKDAATVSQVIKSLTKGSTYYVRVRVYKTVSDVNYYSAWSAAKSVKIVK